MFEKDIIIVDLETDMVDDGDNEKEVILEIGAIRCDRGLNVVDQFHSYIEPEYGFDALRSRVIYQGGYPDYGFQALIGRMEAYSILPSGEQVMRNFHHWAGDCTMAAWPVAFERPYILHWCNHWGVKHTCDRRWIDLATVARYHISMIEGVHLKSWSAKSVGAYLGIKENARHHEALYDCEHERKITQEICIRTMNALQRD